MTRYRRFVPVTALAVGLLLCLPGPSADASYAALDVCGLADVRDGLVAAEVLDWEEAGFEVGGCGDRATVLEVRLQVTRSVYGPREPGELTVRLHVYGELDRLRLERDGAPTRGYLFYDALADGPLASDQDYFWFDEAGLLRNVWHHADAPLTEVELLRRAEAVRAGEACPPDEAQRACLEVCRPCLTDYACEGHCGVHAECILAADGCGEVTACVQGPQPTCADVCETCLQAPSCRDVCSEHGACIDAANTCEAVAACVE